MAQVSLLSYLQYGPPAVPVIDQGQSRKNTTNDNYSAADITQVGQWPQFNLGTIMAQYGPLLANTLVTNDPPPPSPPQPINSESGFRDTLAVFLKDRVRRSLRSGFGQLALVNQLGNRTPLTFGNGALARTIDNFIPDKAYFNETIPNLRDRPNRAPGDAKPSYKWSTALQNSQTLSQRTEFRQALSQVNWYMKQHGTRYGFIITDREFVAIQRTDTPGHLLLSNPVAWTSSGTSAQPRLTVMLALWYLGMLASDDQNWSLA